MATQDQVVVPNTYGSDPSNPMYSQVMAMNQNQPGYAAAPTQTQPQQTLFTPEHITMLLSAANQLSSMFNKQTIQLPNSSGGVPGYTTVLNPAANRNSDMNSQLLQQMLATQQAQKQNTQPGAPNTLTPPSVGAPTIGMPSVPMANQQYPAAGYLSQPSFTNDVNPNTTLASDQPVVYNPFMTMETRAQMNAEDIARRGSGTARMNAETGRASTVSEIQARNAQTAAMPAEQALKERQVKVAERGADTDLQRLNQSWQLGLMNAKTDAARVAVEEAHNNLLERQIDQGKYITYPQFPGVIYNTGSKSYEPLPTGPVADALAEMTQAKEKGVTQTPSSLAASAAGNIRLLVEKQYNSSPQSAALKQLHENLQAINGQLFPDGGAKLDAVMSAVAATNDPELMKQAIVKQLNAGISQNLVIGIQPTTPTQPTAPIGNAPVIMTPAQILTTYKARYPTKTDAELTASPAYQADLARLTSGVK